MAEPKKTDAIAPNPELEAMRGEIEALKSQLKATKQRARFGEEIPEEIEARVQARIDAGLTREQAIAVEKDQIKSDEKLKAESKK